MGRRKSKKKPPKKIKREVAKIFDCPFCNHSKTVECKISKKESEARVACRICGASYVMATSNLTEPIDVFSEWIDECHRVSNPDAVDDPAEGRAGAPRANGGAAANGGDRSNGVDRRRDDDPYGYADEDNDYQEDYQPRGPAKDEMGDDYVPSYLDKKRKNAPSSVDDLLRDQQREDADGGGAHKRLKGAPPDHEDDDLDFQPGADDDDDHHPDHAIGNSEPPINRHDDEDGDFISGDGDGNANGRQYHDDDDALEQEYGGGDGDGDGGPIDGDAAVAPLSKKRRGGVIIDDSEDDADYDDLF